MRHDGMPFPTVEETPRPYRLWDAKRKCHLVGRNYASEVNAVNGALVLMYWSGVGDAVEVYDVTTGRLIRQFTRKATSVADFDPRRKG